jgi:hypothetical protein
LLFSYFGHTLMVAGGTLLQLGVPVMLAVYFVFQRQPTGTAFCSFFFFENFLNVATYMADSRRLELTYITVGDPDFAEHDWLTMFSQMGVLEYDTKIAAVVRAIGWLGMIAVAVWLWRRTESSPHPQGRYPSSPTHVHSPQGGSPPSPYRRCGVAHRARSAAEGRRSQQG